MKSIRLGAVVVCAYAALSTIAALLFHHFADEAFSFRWPVVLFGPVGFLADSKFRWNYVTASAIILALVIPVAFKRSRTTQIMLGFGIAAWLFFGLLVLAIPY